LILVNEDKAQVKLGVGAAPASRFLEPFDCSTQIFGRALGGNPPNKPKAPEVEFSTKEFLREEVKIYRQPDHGCAQTG